MAIRSSKIRLSAAQKKERDLLMRSVGEAVLAFSAIENQLGFMYSMGAGTSPGKAGEHFYTNTDFKKKVVLADAVAAARLKPKYQKPWRRLKQRLLTEHKVRNKIAHLVLMTVVEGDSTRVALRPAWFKPPRKATPQENKKLDELTLNEVVQSAENLRAIKAELWEMITDNPQI